MGRDNEPHDRLEDESYKELRLLEEVDQTPQVSQRHLARRLNIALGVANFLLRSLAKKGYISVTRVGWKRWAYAVTPAGIARKVHLSRAYVEHILNHYQRVRVLVKKEFGDLKLDPGCKIAIYGLTELTELVFLALRDMELNKIEVFDKEAHKRRFLGIPVRNLESLVPGEYTKVMVAYSSNVEEHCKELFGTGVLPSQVVTLFQVPDSPHTESSKAEGSQN